ncbi:ankyrin repeat-containing domain protein [Corynascus similis CBS 632.67]
MHKSVKDARREEEKILNWLSPTDYAIYHSDIARRRQLGTGEWLLKLNEFKSWVSGESRTLYCPGVPGAGKTFISSTVIDYLKAQFGGDPKVGLAYIYCNHRRRAEQQANHLLANVLKQLVQNLRVFPLAEKDLYYRHYFPSVRGGGLVEMLCSVAALYEKRVFLVVDSLDECQEADNCRSEFLTALLNLQSASGSKISIFATSRSSLDIRETFEGQPSVEIVARRRDIEQYLLGRMEELGAVVAGRSDLQQDIISTISDTADGMFLLAHIFFQTLRDRFTAAQSGMDEKLRLLNMMYDNAIERINGLPTGHQELAKHVLAWITLVRSPPSLTQVQHAWAVRDSEDELNQDNLLEAEAIISACGGLVTVDKEHDIIQLIHHTTYDYLEQRLDDWFQDAHGYIAKMCTSYLCFKSFLGGCTTNEDFSERIRNHTLFEYAACQWHWHASRSSNSSQEVLRFLRSDAHVEAASQPLLAHGGEFPGSFNIEGVPGRFTGLHLAAWLGIERATKELLVENKEPDAQDSKKRTPLSYAAENDHAAVINATNMVGETPLLNAAFGGHIEVVQLLLTVPGVDIEASGELGETPLNRAARYGKTAVVEALLSTGKVRINARDWSEAKDCHNRTPLMYAAKNGNVAIVKALLATCQVDINKRDSDGWTPVHHAAKSDIDGVNGVIDTLLGIRQVEVDAKDTQLRTPLSVAAGQGNWACVQKAHKHRSSRG